MGVSRPPGAPELPPNEAQAQNHAWWTRNPMTYDWRGTSTLAPGTREWFEDIDRRFFDAAYYARGADGAPFGRYLNTAEIQRKDVLEVGCGMGTHAALLARAGAALTAIDLTEPAVEMTRRRLETFNLEGRVLQADAEALPFPEHSFDLVWSWGVIHHSGSFERCLAEITRVLRPGGRLLLMVYHRRSLLYYVHNGLIRGILMGQLRRRTLEEIYSRNMDGAWARLFSRGELQRHLTPCYKDVNVKVVGQKAELFPVPASPVKRRLEAATPDGLASAILGRLGFLLVATARKSEDAY